MWQKNNSHNTMILILLLFTVLIFVGLIKFSGYVGIPLSDTNDEGMMIDNIIDYGLFFISILLALHIFYLLYGRKKYGEWTAQGKAKWRYCLIGTITVVVICTPIEYLNTSETLKEILKGVVIIGVAAYFYIKYDKKYLKQHKYTHNIEGGSTGDNKEENLQNKP